MKVTPKNDIPPPDHRSTKYPFGSIPLGQYIFLPHDPANVRNAARSYGKNHKMRFRVRQAKEGTVNGCNVWRIE